MITTVFGVLVILLAMIGLGVGVLAGRGALSGSCGGLGCHNCAGCPTGGGARHRDNTDQRDD